MRFLWLLIAVVCTLAAACPAGTEEKSGASADFEKAWSKVAIEKTRSRAPA